MTVATPRPYENAPRETQRARSRSPTRPGSTLLTATPRRPSRRTAADRPRRGDLAPARCLEPVDAPHTHHGAEQRNRRTSCTVRQTAPRSAPRIARKRKTADAGMPMAAAIQTLRRLGPASGHAGTARALGEGIRRRRSPLQGSSQAGASTIPRVVDRPSRSSRQDLRRSDHERCRARQGSVPAGD